MLNTKTHPKAAVFAPLDTQLLFAHVEGECQQIGGFLALFSPTQCTDRTAQPWQDNTTMKTVVHVEEAHFSTMNDADAIALVAADQGNQKWVLR